MLKIERWTPKAASSSYDTLFHAFVLALPFIRPVLFRTERSAASGLQNSDPAGGDRLLHRGTAAGAACVLAEEPAETK